MTPKHDRPRHKAASTALPLSSGDVQAWLRPWLLAAAVALLVARPLLPSESVAWRGDGLPLVMGWCCLAVVWLGATALGRSARFRLQSTDAALAALVAWHTLAALRAVRDEAPRPAWNMLWEWLGLGLGYFLIRQLLATRREARALVAVMVGLGALLGAYGLRQYLVDLPATRAEYRADPDAALRRSGQWYPPGSKERWLFEQRLESKEPLATFALSNSLAGYLAPWLVVALALPLASRGDKRYQGLLVLLAGVPMLICLVLTKSRSAYLATALGTVALALLALRTSGRSLRGPLAVGASLLAAALVAGLALGGLDREVLTEAPKSLGYRLQYWQATWGMIREFPWFGCGPGNFGDHYTAYKLPEASEEIADPHNFLLEVWATAGTPAAAALVALLVACWRVVWVHPWRLPAGESEGKAGARNSPDAVPQILGGAMAGFLLVWVLSPIVDGPLVGLEVLAAAGLMAAWLALAYRPWIAAGQLLPPVPLLGAGVLLVNLLAAGGIGFPGVASSLWLLIAIGLGECSGYRADHELPRGAVLGLGAVALAAAVGCFVTGYQPVLASSALMAGAESQAARNPARAAELFQAAAEADPWSAEPWRGLCALYFVAWERQHDAPTWEKFTRAVGKSLARRPSSSSLHQEMGDYYLRMYHETGRETALAAARGLYRRAVALYPNSALRRASLAVASHLEGDLRTAARQRDRALELSDETPHVEQKLPGPLRERLEAIGH